ncbi:hypothetical protein C8E03_106195 [Lachnotalea glycerini]|uniref:Uncharacterized protein n=1 Tax=Lachnotalea glycerini TaxID=1763509 RepID=A0A255IM96_9FIRM|nr:hypothetical protein [Lachnotalea glycerini]PXV89543.1 hypothetical protein C8E03_106195 [Lachnotalea glycerini]RDY32278.1 hypothetical protein CG710_004660 [Lachnotalea glycerini]
MGQLDEALYNERRNAIPSWQGYHYQGMTALLYFLKELVNKFEEDENGVLAGNLKIKIEWLEDFIIFDNNEIKKIYQIKKTITKKNRAEVLENFIIQYKIMNNESIKWILGYDSTEVTDLSIDEEEFNKICKDCIENKWIKQITLLLENKDINYWKINLNLQNKESYCKDIRSFIRKTLDLEGKAYIKISDIEGICEENLKPLINILNNCATDFSDFKKRLSFKEININTIDDECINQINKMTSYIKNKNNALSTHDILDKLYTDMYKKMMKLEKKEDQDDFKYELYDVQRVFLDKDNSSFRWEAALYREKEKLLRFLDEEACPKCSKNVENCPNCLLDTIKEWDMKKIIDNINLEYDFFSSENEAESINNKISDVKHDFFVEVIEKFRTSMNLENNGVIGLNHYYALSSLIGGGSKRNENILTGILNNYWKHSDVYRDYESIITQNYNYKLSEENLSFLENTQEEQGKFPLFNVVRKTEFIDYEEVEK